jgi:hypothetical protein
MNETTNQTTSQCSTFPRLGGGPGYRAVQLLGKHDRPEELQDFLDHEQHKFQVTTGRRMHVYMYLRKVPKTSHTIRNQE